MKSLKEYLLEREIKKMLSNITAHWKTTLAGAALAAAGVVANGRSWQSILLAVLTAFLGALAQDPSKSK